MQSVDPDRFGCTLIDWRLPDMNGLDLFTAYIARHGRLTAVLHGDGVGAHDVARAMRRGVFGVLASPLDPHELRTTLDEAMRCDCRRRRFHHEHDANRARIERLTGGERDVLELLMEGRLNKQIASTLGVAVRTVENRRARIMVKLGVRSIVALARFFVQTMLTQQFRQFGEAGLHLAEI